MAVGLAVHWSGDVLPDIARDVIGDALYAAMVTWWIGAAAPAVAVSHRAALALACCLGIELSQLYHAPALDALRSTSAGHLVLGSGFDRRDLAAYTAGVVGAVLVERALARRSLPRADGVPTS